jgi:hypothetical protein
MPCQLFLFYIVSVISLYIKNIFLILYHRKFGREMCKLFYAYMRKYLISLTWHPMSSKFSFFYSATAGQLFM